MTDANYAATKWLGFYAGYHFSNRRIRDTEVFSLTGSTDTQKYEQENNLHSGLAGIRLRPLKPLTISVDGEVGRADNPMYPISEKNYHAFRGRIQYKYKNAQLSAWTRTNYNFNSVSLFAHSSRSRQYGVDGNLNVKSWISIDA